MTQALCEVSPAFSFLNSSPLKASRFPKNPNPRSVFLGTKPGRRPFFLPNNFKTPPKVTCWKRSPRILFVFSRPPGSPPYWFRLLTTLAPRWSKPSHPFDLQVGSFSPPLHVFLSDEMLLVKRHDSLRLVLSPFSSLSLFLSKHRPVPFFMEGLTH